VLGVDVGASPTRRSSAACLLSWDAQSVNWSIQRFRATPEERAEVMGAVVGETALLAAAFDGPFRGALDVMGFYRKAEWVLTRPEFRRRIGKPGQSSAPIGKVLNEHTNYCVEAALPRVGLAQHMGAIHPKAVVEAFPSSFLGVMLADPEALSVKRADRSDVYFAHLAGNGTLTRLLNLRLPGRQVRPDPQAVSNHDDRAALICALTALGVAARAFVSVGDDEGRIVLPPIEMLAPWARQALLEQPVLMPYLVVEGDR
jgi:hypothetical protein